MALGEIETGSDRGLTAGRDRYSAQGGVKMGEPDMENDEGDIKEVPL